MILYRGHIQSLQRLHVLLALTLPEMLTAAQGDLHPQETT